MIDIHSWNFYCFSTVRLSHSPTCPVPAAAAQQRCSGAAAAAGAATCPVAHFLIRRSAVCTPSVLWCSSLVISVTYQYLILSFWCYCTDLLYKIKLLNTNNSYCIIQYVCAERGAQFSNLLLEYDPEKLVYLKSITTVCGVFIWWFALCWCSLLVARLLVHCNKFPSFCYLR